MADAARCPRSRTRAAWRRCSTFLITAGTSRSEFGERVIEPFHRDYLEGRTPNPCVRCNAFVRFDLMLRRVLDLGFDRARDRPLRARRRWPRWSGAARRASIRRRTSRTCSTTSTASAWRASSFRSGRDDQERGARARARVRPAGGGEAREPGDLLHPARRDRCATSQSGCPCEQAPSSTAAGRELGTHRGTATYTVGQRGGLRLARGGRALVRDADRRAANRLVVGRREELADHRGALCARSPSSTRRRSSHCAARCGCATTRRAIPATYASGRLTLDEPFLGAAPGQAAVLYSGTRVLGGGNHHSGAVTRPSW